MATAQDIIDSALRLLNVTASGETPTAIERADGLITLNQMLSSWSASGIAIPQDAEDAFTLTGLASYGIGSGSTINTTRPLVVKTVVIHASGVAQEAKVATAKEWAKIEDFTRAGKFAELAWFNPTAAVAVASINLWPTPASGGLLRIVSLKALSQFAALSTPVSMPEGYERALRALLALELAPEYGAQVTETLIANAQDAKAAILGMNAAVLGTPPSQAQQEQPAA